MKVIFDSIIFNLQTRGGISLYWRELVKRSKHLDSVEVKSRYSDNIFAQNGEVECRRTVYFTKPVPLERISNFGALSNERAIFHSSYYRVSKSDRHINIVTVHDFTHELISKKTLKSRVLSYLKKRAIRKAQGIICISENTKSDLFSLFPKVDPARVRIIHNGKQESVPVNPALRLAALLPPKYFLFVGSRAEYKNARHGFTLLREMQGLWLVLVSGGELTESELGCLGEDVGRVFLAGDVSGEELSLLYRNAEFLFHPSEYEGFGITVVEAQASGCPVIARDCSSVPEVAGGAAFLFNDFEQGFPDILGYIELLSNDEFRGDVVSRGLTNSSRFTWDKCAKETFLFYRYIIGLGT